MMIKQYRELHKSRNVSFSTLFAVHHINELIACLFSQQQQKKKKFDLINNDFAPTAAG